MQKILKITFNKRTEIGGKDNVPFELQVQSTGLYLAKILDCQYPESGPRAF